jgi:RHS repeat-associated protein
MHSSRFLLTAWAAVIGLNLAADNAFSQSGPENKRCLTREQLLIEPLFSACPALIDEASVSDNSFIAKLYIQGGPSTYTMRWLGQNYFAQNVFIHDPATGLYDGFCGTYACSIPPGGWVEQEHWEYFVGTLMAEHVGPWTYEELHDDVVVQSRTFDVRELSLDALSGADQIGVVDQPLPRPLVLKLESFEETGIEDEVIGWELTGPKGAKRASVDGIGSGSETDAEGIDEAFIRLGSKPGAYSLRLNNRRVTVDSEPTFTFTAIDDIEDTDPVPEHPDFEEGVGENLAQQCDFVGNPVALSLGNKFQREVDLEAVGISPIEFIRYHNSLGFVSNSFRNYWTHSYDRYLEVPADPLSGPVKVVRPDGRKVNFNWDGAAYQAYPGVYSTLEQTDTGWRFTDQDLTVETFDEEGLLVDVTDLRGRVQTAVRDAGGRLVRIESNSGDSLDFSYDGSGRLEEVTDQAGRSWTYGYEVLGRLAHVDNPDGTRREYHYEDLRHAYALTGITTENGGRYSWYEYDEQGRATASYHAGDSDRVDVLYEADGSRIVTDPLGNTTVYQTRLENKRGVLESISGPVCSEGCGETDIEVDYDENLNVIGRTSHGVTTRFGDYDFRGQPGYVIQAAGTPEEKWIDYEYDPAFFNRPTRISEPSVHAGESKVTTRTYDFNGNMLSETISGFDPFGNAVSRTVNHAFEGPLGQISSSDGPRLDVGDVTTYEYYPNAAAEGANRARLKAIVDPNGIRVRDEILYSATGKILAELHPNGVELAYAYYPGNDRIKSLIESGDGVFNRTQWEYSPAGDVVRLVLDGETGAEIVTQFSYDAARRLRRVDSRIAGGVPGTVGQRVTYAFDSAGNIVTETYESSDAPDADLVISKVFDAYNRIDTITRGGIIEDFDYNPDGTLAAQTDGKLNITNYTYDAFQRLTSTARLGQITTFGYDTQGREAAVTDPEGHTTLYWHDDLGNRVRQDSPDTGVTQWTHSPSGQVLSETDAKGQVTLFSYDAAGRLTGIDRAGTDYDVTYGFDDCPHGEGRLCTVTTGWGHVVEYAWNPIGELVTLTTNEGQVKYTHGPGNSLTSIEYPSGRLVLFDIDSGGLPVEIRLQQPGGTEAVLVQEIKYTAMGRPIGWQFANGLETTISVDGRHRPVAFDVPGVMTWQADAYDANDNLLELTTGAGAHTFGYDPQDRLSAATSATYALSYSHDAVGNRLSRVSDGAAELGTYEADSNRILSFGNRQFTLDPNGNMTLMSVGLAPERSYTYSGHDRLVEVIDESTSTTLADYRYDGLGQRVQKTTASGTRKFIYGLNGELLAELDGAGNILHEFVYLDGRPIVDLFELPDPPPPAASGEIVIDDADAAVYGANWQTKSSAYAVNGTYLQNRKREGRLVRWYVDPPGFEGGAHDVFVKWLQPPGEGISTAYNIKILNEPNQRVWVDHSLHNLGDWVLLGNFEFAPAGDSPGQWVDLSGFDNDTGFEGTFLEADAVKVVPTSIPAGQSQPVFIHGDHLGTPQFATDQNGAIVWSASYLPFGEAVVDEDADGDGQNYSLNLRFPGQYFDVESGLHYNYFRTYDPGLGRYLESDPIGLEGGWNTYAYVGGNPLNLVDPLGLYQMCHRDLLLPIPYARHCYVRFDDGSTSSFGPSGVNPDPDPNQPGTICTNSKEPNRDDCIKKAMKKCLGSNYSFTGFNCCHCVEQAMKECGTSIPPSSWPNWPINPGPQPGEPGYSPLPVYDPSLGQ